MSDKTIDVRVPISGYIDIEISSSGDSSEDLRVEEEQVDLLVGSHFLDMSDNDARVIGYDFFIPTVHKISKEFGG